MAKSQAVKAIGRLGFPYETMDPFLFCVFHKDDYPPGDAKMQMPNGERGNGADFNSDKPYRMYHGDRQPGFPQHPHRGFETLTATVYGMIDHSDSLGCAGRVGDGDLQWMTAGRGVVHCEMFPLINKTGPNKTKFFQIWLNLERSRKMVDPYFVMHWAEGMNHAKIGGCDATVWAGQLGEILGQRPPPDSWAADPDHDVGVFWLAIPPGCTFTLPPANRGAAVNRRAYFHDGETASFDGTTVKKGHFVTLLGQHACPISVADNAKEAAEILILQGVPIGEPVVQNGPFVMNTQEEIRNAFLDYRQTGFGGWPWPTEGVVHPREKGRFALQGGKEEFPPAQ
eukprot:NODE_1994_length_1332_cov_32.413094_g1810_i0.p1 GENE.NODE_1994_length_1332_cov_32.413094_g1810_i0~~NODE_1994_length_1332_cov_32.413094_g1810_i0.p1  ORF type:complete len:363 (+),score=63.27 NODE_1994_length_1332_cov_32.413094_g1810_i0:70-1089(+)